MAEHTEGTGSPAARAAAILRANGFIVTGVADEDGPWTAAVHYRLLHEAALYFESDHRSRHGRAIDASGIASGVIFDSSIQPIDADGVQLRTRARSIEPTAEAVAATLNERLFPPAQPVAEETAEILAIEPKRLYRLDIERLYVFDRDAWRRQGTDDRIEVDAAEVWALLEVEAAARG